MWCRDVLSVHRGDVFLVFSGMPIPCYVSHDGPTSELGSLINALHLSTQDGGNSGAKKQKISYEAEGLVANFLPHRGAEAHHVQEWPDCPEDAGISPINFIHFRIYDIFGSFRCYLSRPPSLKSRGTACIAIICLHRRRGDCPLQAQPNKLPPQSTARRGYWTNKEGLNGRNCVIPLFPKGDLD